MIDLRQGDCLKLMKDVPDNSIDMILTDPPYGMNLTPQRVSGKFNKVKIINDDNLNWTDKFFSECYRVLPKDNCVSLFFCSHHSISAFITSAKLVGFDIKNLLIWDKDWFGMGNNWRPNHELILVVSKGRFCTKSNNKSNILKYRRLSSQSSIHPTQKPTQLLEELIDEPDYNPKNILDPFMGSGSTGIACLNTNRNFIGIELDKPYFKIASDRINNHNLEKESAMF